MGAELEGLDSLNAKLERMSQRWGGSATWVVGTDKEYGVFMEYGTRPHRIEGDPLVFTVNGQTVYTQVVDHPGTEPRPYMRPALFAAERQLGGLAKSSDSVEEFIERVALTVEAEAKRRAPVDTGALRASIAARRIE